MPRRDGGQRALSAQSTLLWEAPSLGIHCAWRSDRVRRHYALHRRISVFNTTTAVCCHHGHVQVDTERLHLSPLAMSDHADLYRLQQDPEMMRYLGDGRPYAEHQSVTWLEWNVAMWETEGYGFWAARDRADDAFLGWIGVTKVFDPPELLEESEVGWFVDRQRWGQGLATEGAREALRFAFDDLGLPRVIARYNAANTASGRVMEKIGMQFWGEMPHTEMPGATTRIYEMMQS